MDEGKKEEVVVSAETEPVVDIIAQKDAEIGKLKGDLENYKTVALKRLGKLPGDADYVAGMDEKTGLTIQETVNTALIEKELTLAEQDKNKEFNRVVKENTELRLALKNRPDTGVGGGSGSGSTTEVKDNVFSEAQIAELTKRATRLGADPQKFIETAKSNIQRGR